MQAFKIIVVLVFIAAQAAMGIDNFRNLAHPRPFPIELKTPGHHPFSPTRITYHKLKKAIEDRLIEDLDGLLSYIAEEREFDNPFQNFVLFHASLSFSRDEVTPLFPRIVFHKDGFIGALTGDPEVKKAHGENNAEAALKAPGYETMPIIELDTKSRDFAFRLIEFKKPDSRGGVRTLCHDEPVGCARCHGTSLRPIIGLDAKSAGAYHREDAEKEKRRFAEFAKSLDDPKMRRYRFFLRKADDYHDDRAFGDLNRHANQLNFMRIFSQLAKSKAFVYRYAVFAALRDCDDIETFLPAGIRLAHERKLGLNFTNLLKETRRILADEIAALEKKGLNRAVNPFMGETYTYQVAKLRYVLEGQSLDTDYDLREWSLSFAPGSTSYGFNAGGLKLEDFVRREFAPGIALRDPELNVSCATLKERSLAVLSARK